MKDVLTVTSQPSFLGLMGYQFSLPVVLCSHTSCAEAPLLLAVTLNTLNLTIIKIRQSLFQVVQYDQEDILYINHFQCVTSPFSMHVLKRYTGVYGSCCSKISY